MGKKRRASKKPSKKSVKPAIEPQQKKEPDLGTDELKSHLGSALKVEGRGTARRHRNMGVDPLNYYYFVKKTISHRQFQAGRRFASDFRHGGLEPSIKPCLALLNLSGGRTQGGAGICVTERQVEARINYRAAREAIHGEAGKILAENVCGYGFFVKELQIEHYLIPSAAIGRLKEALDDLSNYYELPMD